MFLWLQKGEKPLAILIIASQVLAHPLQFVLGFEHTSVLPLQCNDQRLLFGKPPFTFSYVALYLTQLIQESVSIHHDASSTRRKLACRHYVKRIRN